MKQGKIRIGTRGSKLALVQTDLVIQAIKEIEPELAFEIVVFDTQGDKNLEKPLTEFGTQGIFVEEFEEKILRDEIDIAVHSAKDMAVELPKGLEIISVLKREDPRDILVTTNLEIFHEKNPAIVGTSSLRREAQIKELYPHIQCKPIRGDVTARLKKLESGMYDGIILAAAGLKRLNLDKEVKYQYQYLEVDDFIPAPAQGIIAIESKVGSRWTDILHRVCDKNSKIELEIERNLYSLLQESCYGTTDTLNASSIYSKVHDDTVDIWVLKEKDGLIRKRKVTEKLYGEGASYGKSILSWSRSW